MRDKPMTWDELPRVTTTDDAGTKHSAVNWAALGLASITANPENGEPWELHRDKGVSVNGCVFLWAVDTAKMLDAGLGEALLACANGTSWKVSQDEVNRSYDRDVAVKGQRGAKVRETLEHRLWDRITGIRRKAEYRAPTVKIVETVKVVVALPDGTTWTAPATADAPAEYRSAWMAAMLDIGVPTNVVRAKAESLDFAAMLTVAGWKQAETPKE